MNLQDMATGEQPAEQTQSQAATPEQQAQFDKLLARSRTVMAQSAQEWMAALKDDPVRAAVHLGTALLRSLVQQSEKAGVPVDPAVVIHVGITMVKDIAGVANDAGVIPDDKLESFLQEVTQQSIAEYMRQDADEGLMPDMKGKAPDEPGDAPGADNTPAHEGAESPEVEQGEGSEEDVVSRMMKGGAK